MKLLKSIKLAVIGALLTGCAHSVDPLNHQPVMTYHADVRFTPDERKCIQESTDQWRNQTSGIGDAEVVYDYNPGKIVDVISFKDNDRLVRWTHDTPEVLEFEKSKREAEGVDDWTLLGLASGKVTDPIRLPIEVRLVADRFVNDKGAFNLHVCKLTTVHEFGHAFGIPHLGRKTDIMYPSVIPERTACLKSEDLFAFSILNKVPMSVMKPCPDDTVFDGPRSAVDEDQSGAVWLSGTN